MSPRAWTIIGLMSAATLALAAFLWTQRQVAPTSSSTGTLTRLTSDSGIAIAPALSPDGRLVAYASDRAGEGNLDIWVQQVAGGDPIRLTRDAADEVDPTFSADGTQIAFRSERDGGGVYLISALGGEPVLVAPNGHGPRFSPDGQWLAYHTGIPDFYPRGVSLRIVNAKVYVVRPTGGPARQIQPGARSAEVLAWSPDSQHLLILGSFGGPIEWWVTPLEGKASRVDLGLLGQQGLLGGQKPGAYPVAWLPGNRIVFSAQSGDSRNYWAARVSSRSWQIEPPLQRLTFGAGIEGYGLAVAAAGTTRLAFSSDVQNVDLWSVPLDRTGLRALGPPLQLTRDAAMDGHPNVTPDGKTLVWDSTRQRRSDLWARDLVTGRETNLLSLPPFELQKPVISPDRSKVAFFRIGSGYRPPGASLVAELTSNRDGTLRAAQPVELPTVAKPSSGWPWSWSSDGQRLWYSPMPWPRHAPNDLIDIATGKILAHIGHPQHTLYELHLSPDGRWLAFLEELSDNTGRLAIAPIGGGIQPAGPSEWIAITSGDDRAGDNAWAPAGDVLYYESNRDGYVCVWAQRLARDTMKPVGLPVAIHHAHSARLSIGRLGQTERGLTAGRDKVIINMSEMNSSIWMTEFADGGRSPR